MNTISHLLIRSSKVLLAGTAGLFLVFAAQAQEETEKSQAPKIETTALQAAANQISAGVIEVTDPDAGDSITFAITGGADANALSIDPQSGELAFMLAPDPAAPGDANGDSVYEVEVTATDSAGLTDTRTIEVKVSGGESDWK